MNELRKLMQEIIIREIPERDVALLLSGGVDSVSVGFTLEDLKYNIHSYTFRLEGTESRDSKSAKYVAKERGWDHTIIEIPRGNIKEDMIKLAREYDCYKKTLYECLWPFLYVFPSIKEKYVVSGLDSDNHFGLQKNFMIKYHKLKKEGASRERLREFKNDHVNSYLTNDPFDDRFNLMAEENELKHICPFMYKEMYEWSNRFTWEELNKPIQKFKLINAFKEKFRKVGIRKHQSYQLVARIDKLAEAILLNDPTFNKKKRVRMMDVYRDITKEYGGVCR